MLFCFSLKKKFDEKVKKRKFRRNLTYMPPIENRIGWVSNSVVKNKIEKKIKDDSNDSSSESKIESYTATRDKRKFIDTMRANMQKRNAKRQALSPLVDDHSSSDEYIPKKREDLYHHWVTVIG
jgi:hypothetical protein